MHHIRKQNPWLTLLLLLAVGTAYPALALSLSGLNGISWGGDPVLFLWNAVRLRLGLAGLSGGRSPGVPAGRGQLL